MKKLNSKEVDELLWNVGKIQEQYYQNVMDCIEEFVTDEEEREDEDMYDTIAEVEAEWFSFATGDGGDDRRETAKQWLIHEGYMDAD